MAKINCNTCNESGCETRKRCEEADIKLSLTKNALNRCDFYAGPNAVRSVIPRIDNSC